MFPGFPCLLFTFKRMCHLWATCYFLACLLQQCLCFKTHGFKDWWGNGGNQKNQSFFSLVAIYCNQRVLLLLTGAAGGALGPSKHKLHFLNSSQVRIVPPCTSWLVLALSGSGQGFPALSEVFSTSEGQRRKEKVLYVGFWQEMKKKDQYKQK